MAYYMEYHYYLFCVALVQIGYFIPSYLFREIPKSDLKGKRESTTNRESTSISTTTSTELLQLVSNHSSENLNENSDNNSDNIVLDSIILDAFFNTTVSDKIIESTEQIEIELIYEKEVRESI
jgi:hypothetical protein